MKTTLLARSSSGEPYEVEFLEEGNSVRVFCHCQAGMLQRMCKHKLALIKGDAAMLSDPNHEALLSEVHAWPKFAMLKSRVAEYEKMLKEIETTKMQLAKKEREIKEKLAHGLTHGFDRE